MNHADVRYYEALKNIGDLMRARRIVTKAIDYYFAQKMKGYDTDGMMRRLKRIREQIENIEEEVIQFPVDLYL